MYKWKSSMTVYQKFSQKRLKHESGLNTPSRQTGRRSRREP